MFNSIGGWFYRYLAGIQLNGFDKDLIIHPRLTTLLINVEAELNTILGTIFVSWERQIDEKTVSYDITIPNSVHSIITFDPIQSSAHCMSIEESDTVIWHRSSSMFQTNITGILWLRPDMSTKGAMSVAVEGGSYRWKVRWS
jgi:hypothetical protein